MPIGIDELPLDQLPVELARALPHNSPSILNYADQVNKQLGLPDGLIRSTIANGEKSGSMSTSPKGAKGVGQFMPETAKKYGLADPTDPKASIEAMGRYYQNAQKVTGSNDPAILAAAYNSGENRDSLKKGKIPAIPETQAYAKRVANGMPPAQKGMSLEEAMKYDAEQTAGKKKEAEGISPMLQGMNPKQPVTTAQSAFVKSVGESLLPAITGLATFGSGAAAGAIAAAPISAALAMTGPGAAAIPLVEAVASFAGGMAASFGVSYLTRQAQDYLVSSLPDGLLKSLGMDKETRAAEEKQHPYASFAGGLAPNLVTFKPGISTVKQAVQMAGMGGGIEAARELVVDGELDPMKIGLAAVFQGGASNPNKLGKAIIGKTTPPTGWNPLKSVTPKEEYVKEVTGKLGPKFKESAEQLWDETEAKTHPPGNQVLGQGETIGNHIKQLSDAQHMLANQRDVDSLNNQDFLKGMTPEEYAIASGEEIYHSLPGEKNAPSPNKPVQIGGKTLIGKGQTSNANLLTPEQQYIRDRFWKPLREENDALRKRATELGGEEFTANDDINGRFLQSTFINKIARIGDNVMGGAGFAREAGTQKARSMFALEFENGTRKIINLDGRTVQGYGVDKKPFVLANTQKALKLGDTLTANGQKGKIVQATTDHIEAETTLRYNKNAIANELTTRSQLKSYIREKEWLNHTVDAMERIGYVIPKEETNGVAPKGYTTLEGDNRLNKLFVNDRIAYTFRDGILKSSSPGGFLQKVNQAVIGTMFWNPQPHLFNAFDHFYNTIGWDLFKPWQYKSIAKSVYESYKDVSTMSPAYRAYLDSGMGLNYGRIRAEGMYEKMLNGIDAPSMAQLAKSWGTNPTKLVTDIYAGAKNALWGGSDMMMISAYKHLASKQGVDIFNKALRNHVEAHNPNYRVPSQIGFDTLMKIPGMPEAVGKAVSRGLSLGMQSRAFNTFGRYHYGQFRSIGHDIHDVIFQNEKSVEGRGEALSHAAFVAFSVGVVYPYVWDTIAKVVSGDDSAQMRRSGASTIPYTVWNIVMGDETFGKLLGEAYNLPPVTKAALELPANRNLFTGKHIWEPEDNGLGIANDVGLYVAGTVLAPVKSLSQIADDPEKGLASQVGIQTKLDEKEAKMEKVRARNKATAKRRQKTRGYFEGDE